ncbi:hypothetical protein [Streptomyces sp. CBMA29]|uniref:hypothetical protein n=1 Tax=Streptomyces sp. CBMA29 TaxID=1896314 RepID=UPI00166194A2|nr:hypothetical protein [Streptomyces sp. CBMA29]MBD0734680.1 hypothetical protein [Streptomyces sp. CBMA29]
MSIRRAATTIGAVSLGLVALTACDKPTPLATVTVGTRSVTAEAVDKCYAHGKLLPQTIFEACLTAAPKHHLTVGLGDQVRIGVDPKLAKKGWLLANGTQLVTQELLKNQTYWTLDSDTLFTVQDQQTGQSTQVKEVTLNIVESGDLTGRKTYGIWKIKLVRGK